jgi:hypothetical protein
MDNRWLKAIAYLLHRGLLQEVALFRPHSKEATTIFNHRNALALFRVTPCFQAAPFSRTKTEMYDARKSHPKKISSSPPFLSYWKAAVDFYLLLLSRNVESKSYWKQVVLVYFMSNEYAARSSRGALWLAGWVVSKWLVERWCRLSRKAPLEGPAVSISWLFWVRMLVSNLKANYCCRCRCHQEPRAKLVVDSLTGVSVPHLCCWNGSIFSSARGVLLSRLLRRVSSSL